MDEEFKACYRFIRDDIRLCAVVNKKTGKQTLVMEKLKKQFNEKDSQQNPQVEFRDFIDCIHTAIVEFPAEEVDDTIRDIEFEKKALKLRSSEEIKEINLEPEEKFKAFNSWVAGIAEAGLDALKIQSEIEGEARLIIPISLPIMRFLSKISLDIMFEYISYLERVCLHEGIQHEASLIANLDPILDLILEKKSDSPESKKILKALFQINPPIKLFTLDHKKAAFLQNPDAADMSQFPFAFNGVEPATSNVIQNPRATEFKEYERFLSYKTEPNYYIRCIAASNENATKFSAFKNFLSIETEPDYRVRKCAANNPKSKKFAKDFKNFMSHDTEPIAEVRKIVAHRVDVVQQKEFINFLSYKTEPDDNVRKMASRNPVAQKLPEYVNFLSITTEPNHQVRLIAALSPFAKQRAEFSRLLSESSEPIPEVREAANLNIDYLEFKDRKVSTIDYDLYNNLQEEYSKLEIEFQQDNKELLLRKENLKNLLFPPEMDLEDDLSRELERLKQVAKEKKEPGPQLDRNMEIKRDIYKKKNERVVD